MLTGGTALGQGILIAVSPLLTRLYTPSDMGGYAIYTAVISVGSVVVCLRYETAIVGAADADVPSLGALAALLLVPMSTIVTLLAFIGARVGVFGLGALGPAAIALAFPALFLSGAANLLRFWFIRTEDLRPVSALIVLQNGARALSQVLLGIPRLASIGLLGGDVFGRACGVFGLARKAYAEYRAARGTAAARLGPVARQYRVFSTYFLLSSLIDVVSLSLPVLLLAEDFGTGAAGEFSVVQRVISAPIALIGSTFADAFFGRLAALARTEPLAARQFFWRSARTLAIGALGPVILLAVLAKPTFPIVFGPQWSRAGTMASLLAPWAFAQFVVSPLSRAVLVYEGQRLKLIYDFATLALVVAVFRIARVLALPTTTTIGALSAVESFAFALYFGILVAIMRRPVAADAVEQSPSRRETPVQRS